MTGPPRLLPENNENTRHLAGELLAQALENIGKALNPKNETTASSLIDQVGKDIQVAYDLIPGSGDAIEQVARDLLDQAKAAIDSAKTASDAKDTKTMNDKLAEAKKDIQNAQSLINPK